MKSKSAQIKFGETIGVIIIVYIVVVVGFVWYNNVNSQNLAEMYDQDRKNLAFEKYYFIVNLDLIRESQRGFVDEEFDLDSLRVLSNYSQNQGREYMSSRLGFANVTILLLDPNNYQNVEEEISLYESYPEFSRVTALETFRTLVPVIDNEEDKTKLALLEVQVPVVEN